MGIYVVVRKSRKSKLAISGDGAPGRKGVKMQWYHDIPSFRNTVARDISASSGISGF
jgi:hypothetical protein